MKPFTPVALLCALLACGRKADTSAPSNTMIDMATHSARYFPIGPGTVHGPAAGQQQVTTCNGCHADRSAAPQTTCSTPPPCYPPSASFKTVTCTGCHVEVQPGVFHDDIAGLGALSGHAGQTAFDPAQPVAFDQACLGCHRDGAGGTPPAYHADLFPIDATSKHAGIGCSSCHGSSRADLTQLKCASCHADSSKSASFPTRHDPIQTATGTIEILVVLTPPPPASCAPSPLPPLQSPDCLRCHAKSNVDHVELSHPAGNSAFGQDSHKGAGCFTCHLTTKQLTATVTPPTPAPSGYPTVDFTQPSNPSNTSTPGCITCHSYGCGGGGL